jgi:hypothetical protein
MSWVFSALASRETISSCISNRSVMGLSNRSAQRCFDVYQLRVDPKSVAATLHRTFEHIADVQLRPICFTSIALPLKVNAVLRAITSEPAMRDRSVVRLSVTPSAK